MQRKAGRPTPARVDRPAGAFRPHPVGGGFLSRHPVGDGLSAVTLWGVGSQSSFNGPQKVSFQLLILPVSAEATSWTRSFHVPLAVSLEAFTV